MEEKYVEEFNIEIPKRNPSRSGRPRKYDILYDMKIGSSFYVENSENKIRKIRSTINQIRLKTGKKFVTRHESTGHRVFRVE